MASRHRQFIHGSILSIEVIKRREPDTNQTLPLPLSRTRVRKRSRKIGRMRSSKCSRQRFSRSASHSLLPLLIPLLPLRAIGSIIWWATFRPCRRLWSCAISIISAPRGCEYQIPAFLSVLVSLHRLRRTTTQV